MRFRGPKRLRIISGASLLLLLTAFPLAIWLTRSPATDAAHVPGVVSAYASGIASFAWIAPAAAALALALWARVFLGQRRQIHLRYLGEGARRRHNLAETARSVAIILGAAGLITGSLLDLYAALMQTQPDIYDGLPLPAFAAPLALACLFGGGTLYAVGRLGR